MGKITYKQGATKREITGYISAIGAPLVLFLAALYILNLFGDFGRNLLTPMTGGIWSLGAACAVITPSQRKELIKETHIFVAVYLIGVLLFRVIIYLVTQTNSAQFMASYDVPMPDTAAVSITGSLQMMMWVSAVMGPIGFATMLIKKTLSFRRGASKTRMFERLRGIRSQDGHRK